MSRVIGIEPPRIGTETPPARVGPLGWVRRIGYGVLGLELAGFLVWSAMMYSHFAVTPDFLVYYQPWFQIAHGHLDPRISLSGFPFWRNHFELFIWPTALLYWLWPHGVTLLWLQDICVLTAEAVAFTWLCEIAACRGQGKGPAWLAGAGLVLLAANPWVWWALSWDFHGESVASLLAVLLGWDLVHRRRRAWAWVALLLTCGDVAGTYLFGVGLGAMLTNPRWRWRGALIAGLGLCLTLLITLCHANEGSAFGLQAYDYLIPGTRTGPLSIGALATGILTHPGNVVTTLWGKRLDIMADLAPGGLVGIGSPAVLPILLVVLLANALFPSLLFTEPTYQSLPIYVILPIGTIGLLAWLMRRHRRTALVLAGVLAAQALGWSAVWSPRTPSQWLRVPNPTAATLAELAAHIPASDEIIVSQGVAGKFGNHPDVHPIFTAGPQPLKGGETWFIIAPLAGLESQTTESAMAFLGELAGPLHARLVTHANGVWAFRWRPPPGMNVIHVPGESMPLPAWAAPRTPGEASRQVLTGPPGTWHMSATGGVGYVADGLAWLEPPGRYRAVIRLSSSRPVNVEIWNDTGDVLLRRQTVPVATGVQKVVVSVSATTIYSSQTFRGWGPFRADFIPPPPGNRLEIRVWSPGGGSVNVYGAVLDGVRTKAH